MKKILKIIVKIIVIIIFITATFLIFEEPVNRYFADKETIEKLVNDVNSLIDNPEDKIESNDILWFRKYNYTTNRESEERYVKEIPADEDKPIKHAIFYIQLDDYRRSERTDNLGSDYAENREMLLNFSYDYSFGNGYYIYYSTPAAYRIFEDDHPYYPGVSEDLDILDYWGGFGDRYKTLLPLEIYRLEQNLFSEDRNSNPPSSRMTILAIGDEKVKINPVEKYDVFDHSRVDGQNFRNIMMKWDQKLNENIIELVKIDAEDLKDFQLSISLLNVGGSSSCSSLSDGDWAYPNFDNATAAFKFNSNNTFNYSNTYTNTTRYGTWESIDNCSYQLKYRNGDMKTIYISGDSFTIGSTKYKKY